MNISILDQQILPNLYTPRERQSMYQVLCAMRQIGGHSVLEKEQEIKQIMKWTNISTADQTTSRTLSQSDMTTTLKSMNEIKKRYFAKFISCVALVGGTTPKENQAACYLFNMFEIPNVD